MERVGEHAGYAGGVRTTGFAKGQGHQRHLRAMTRGPSEPARSAGDCEGRVHGACGLAWEAECTCRAEGDYASARAGVACFVTATAERGDRAHPRDGETGRIRF